MIADNPMQECSSDEKEAGEHGREPQKWVRKWRMNKDWKLLEAKQPQRQKLQVINVCSRRVPS